MDAPEPFKPKPKSFPEEDRLFRVQKNALRAVNATRALEREFQGRDLPRPAARQLREAVDAAEDTYRVIRSYLEKYSDGAPGATGLT